jgi:glutamate-1-semialdehyde aminotransferase
LADAILTPTREPSLLSSQVQQGPGHLRAQEFFGVQADLATFSKAMSNGFCISAIAGRADVMRCLGRTHMSSTFCANSAEMAAALTTIGILRDSKCLQRVWALGAHLQEGLRQLIAEYGVSAQVVGYPPSPFLMFTASDERNRHWAQTVFYTETTRHGVLLHPNHHWFLCAAHTAEDVAFALDACRKGFSAVSSGAPVSA